MTKTVECKRDRKQSVIVDLKRHCLSITKTVGLKRERKQFIIVELKENF